MHHLSLPPNPSILFFISLTVWFILHHPHSIIILFSVNAKHTTDIIFLLVHVPHRWIVVIHSILIQFINNILKELQHNLITLPTYMTTVYVLQSFYYVCYYCMFSSPVSMLIKSWNFYLHWCLLFVPGSEQTSLCQGVAKLKLCLCMSGDRTQFWSAFCH